MSDYDALEGRVGKNWVLRLDMCAVNVRVLEVPQVKYSQVRVLRNTVEDKFADPRVTC